MSKVKNNMFIPYHIENWVIVMDVKYMGAMSLPIKTIRRITDVTTVNFCSTMDQMLILNPSLLTVIETLPVASLRKICFIDLKNANDRKVISDKIDLD
jgi:hypothetical protein